MPWKNTATGAELSGEIADWVKRFRKRHESCDHTFKAHVPLDEYLWVAAAVSTKKAREVWQAGWFTKGKIRKLDALIVLEPSADGSVAMDLSTVFNVLDFIAENLNAESRREIEKDLDAIVQRHFIDKLKRSGNLILLALYEQPDRVREWGLMLVDVHRSNHSHVQLHVFIAKAAEYFAKQSLAAATNPNAPVIAALTPMLAAGPDGLVVNPFAILGYMASFTNRDRMRTVTNEFSATYK